MTYDSKLMTYEHFGEVLDFETVNQYVCAVKQLMCTQRSEGLITLNSEDIMTDRLKRIIKEVKTRKNAVTKALYKERIDGEYDPFKMIGEVPKIEKYLWEYTNKTLSFGASSLRDCFQFLMSLCEVL